MNWFKGSITEAVTLSKQRNATFVVYIEGKDENSIKLTGFLNQPEIRQKLEDDRFVAIRIEGGTEPYMQFATLYQIVPVPSLFFIGKNGVPLEIATGIIASTDELGKKIDNVLKLTGKQSSSLASASEAFIANEQKRDLPSTSTSSGAASAVNKDKISQEDLSSISDIRSNTESKPVEDTFSSKSSLSSIELPTSSDAPESSVVSPPNDLYCTDTTCFRKPKNVASSLDTADPPSDNTSSLAESISMDTVPAPSVTVPVSTLTPPDDVSENSEVEPSIPDPSPTSDQISAPTTASSPAPAPASASASATAPAPDTQENSQAAKEKLDQAKQLIEERRKLKEAEEQRQARERELNRRKEGKAVQGMQNWQKEQDFKQLKESIRRDRLEDQAARQRILEQIASDRAERANKFNPPNPNPTTQPTQPTTPTIVNAATNLEMSRIQFRIPNGETNTMSFESSDTFGTVRAYVKGVVIKGTGIKDFTLATTFPKHEFTDDDDKKTLLDLGLAPSAVILIIGKASSGPSAVVARSGGIVNIFNTVFWAIISPVLSVFGYIRSFIIGRNDDAPRPSNSGAQKRANEERIDANDSAKKRNLDRFTLTKDGPSTSKEAMASANTTGGAYRRAGGGSNIHRLSDQRKDSDDENNTWNGNSTQQQ